jgi:hypothetical protein
MRTRDLKTRNHIGAFYIGLGDQFDDDRRFVRETTERSVWWHVRLAQGAAPPIHWRAEHKHLQDISSAAMLAMLTHERRLHGGFVVSGRNQREVMS